MRDTYLICIPEHELSTLKIRHVWFERWIASGKSDNKVCRRIKEFSSCMYRNHGLWLLQITMHVAGDGYISFVSKYTKNCW